jgi:hypothetical protein
MDNMERIRKTVTPDEIAKTQELLQGQKKKASG